MAKMTKQHGWNIDNMDTKLVGMSYNDEKADIEVVIVFARNGKFDIFKINRCFDVSAIGIGGKDFDMGLAAYVNNADKFSNLYVADVPYETKDEMPLLIGKVVYFQ